MTRDLPKPEWLSPEQALELLQEQDRKLTMADMASYCAELKLFPVYVRLRMAKGEIPDDRTSAYGLGDYVVNNPDDLLHGSERVTLHLRGDVFNAPDPQASKLRNVEWEYTTEKSNLRVLFKRSELEQLNASSTAGGVTTTDEGEPSLNHLIIISKLIEMLKDKSRPSYTQERIAATIAKEYGHILGLGDTTLRTLFAAANQVRKSAPPRPPSVESKIRLDKKEIQLD